MLLPELPQLLEYLLGADKKPYPIPKRPTAIKMKENVFNLLENVYISITMILFYNYNLLFRFHNIKTPLTNARVCSIDWRVTPSYSRP